MPVTGDAPSSYTTRRDAIDPELVAEYRRGRGPQIAATKRQVTLRLDGDLLGALRAQGKGWQIRVNEMLRKDVFGT